MPETDALTRDHIELEDTRVTQRGFAGAAGAARWRTRLATDQVRDG